MKIFQYFVIALIQEKILAMQHCQILYAVSKPEITERRTSVFSLMQMEILMQRLIMTEVSQSDRKSTFIERLIHLGPAATVTTTSTTTTQAPTAPPCSNGGVLVGTLCNCPSGFSGPFCQIRNGKNSFEFFYKKMKFSRIQRHNFATISSVRTMAIAQFEILTARTNLYALVNLDFSANIVKFKVKQLSR